MRQRESTSTGHPRRDRRILAWLAGIVAGALTGTVAVALAGTAVAHRLDTAPTAPFLEASHLPPLLTAQDEPIELRYDVYCSPATEDRADEPCDAEGTVFVRAGDAGPYRALALQEAEPGDGGRFVARVPDLLARSPTGFSYYAVLRSRGDGSEATLPAGGAAAPQRSLPLEHPVDVELGRHEFGRTRKPDARVVEAAWGSDEGEIGLEPGRAASPLGGSAFDLAQDGTVHLLDEANRRLLRWRPGAPAPSTIALRVNGTLADLAVADDGTAYVLETTAPAGTSPLLRVFGPDGASRGATEIAERASQVRIGPEGRAVVLQHPSGQWMTVATSGRLLDPRAQRASGRPGRRVGGGGEVIVLRRDRELRVAVAGPGEARRSWRVHSGTALAEVQLAEPLGSRLVLVVRVYSETSDEFVALVLGPQGVVTRIALASADWAETAPLSRFRLRGSSLYQLGSTPAGMFVDRYDLEVR